MSKNSEEEARRRDLNRAIEKAVYKVKPVTEGRYFRGTMKWSDKVFVQIAVELGAVWTGLCNQILRWEINNGSKKPTIGEKHEILDTEE